MVERDVGMALAQSREEVLEGGFPVYRLFSRAEEIEIRAVQDQYFHRVRFLQGQIYVFFPG
jgi:hypothetical protein